jgi:hypothetical protein
MMTPCAERTASLAARAAARGVSIDPALALLACRAANAAPDVRLDRVRGVLGGRVIVGLASDLIAEAILRDCRAYAKHHAA